MIDFGFGVTLGTIPESEIYLLRQWRNDKRIWKWCRQNDLITESQHANWFSKIQSDPTIKMYMIRAPDTEPVGVCGLTSIDMVNRRAEFSLYIAPDMHKGGYGKKALSTLLSHGFLNLGLHTIWGESFEGNPAMRMFEKLGMNLEGVRRDYYFRDGHFIDAYLYSIQAPQWGLI